MKKPYLVAQWLFSLALLVPCATHAESLRALILLNDPTQAIKPKNSETLQGAYVFGMIPPGNWNILRAQLETAARNRPIDAETIEQLSDILVQWYQENSDMSVRVIVLADDLDGNGILQLAIIPETISDTETESPYESMEVGEIAETNFLEPSHALTTIEVDPDDLPEESYSISSQPIEEELAELPIAEIERVASPAAEELVVIESPAVEELTPIEAPYEVASESEEQLSIEERDIVATIEQQHEELTASDPESTYEEDTQEIASTENEEPLDIITADVTSFTEEEESLLTAPETAITHELIEGTIAEEGPQSLPSIEQELQEVTITPAAIEVEPQEITASEALLHEDGEEPEDSVAEEVVAIEQELVEESFEEESEEIALFDEEETEEMISLAEELSELVIEEEPQEITAVEDQEIELVATIEEEIQPEEVVEENFIADTEIKQLPEAVEAENIGALEEQEIVFLPTKEAEVIEIAMEELAIAEPEISLETDHLVAAPITEELEEAEPIVQIELQEYLPTEEAIIEIASAEPEQPMRDESPDVSPLEATAFALTEEEALPTIAIAESEPPESFVIETQEYIAADPEEEQAEVVVAELDTEERYEDRIAIEEEELFAIADQEPAPEQETCTAEESFVEDYPSAPIGKALVLINDVDKLLSPEEESACEGTCLFGSIPPGDLPQLQQILETIYLDKPLDDEAIAAIQQAVEAWYQLHGAQNITVAIPEQPLTQGVLQLVVGLQVTEEIAHDEESNVHEEEEIYFAAAPVEQALPEELLPIKTSESLSIAANDPLEPVIAEVSDDTSATTTVGRALILLGSEDHLFEPSELDSMEGTSTFGLAPPGDMAHLQKILDEIYLDHPLDAQTIQALKLALYEWYEDHGDNTLEVIIPEQALATGALQIILNNESTHQNPLDQRSSLQPRGRTLLLVDSQEHLLPLEEAEKFVGVNTLGLKLPGTFASLQAKLAPVYLGQPLNMETINAVKQAIYQWYEERDHPFVLVTVPPQKVTHGVVQMMVLKAKLGEVSVEGNQWFSDNCLKKYVKIQPGQDIDVYTLQSDLNFINRNPFRRVNMLYTAGAQAGMTDVILTVEDRPPYQFYIGTENNGMVGTQRNRIVSGFSIGKLFGLDHIINFQYTGAYNYQRFSACSGQYMMLLPWGHMINIYGGYSALHANIVSPQNSNTGRSIQSSFRYTMPCHQEPGFMGEVSLGFDFKSTNNTLAFTSAFENYSGVVNVSQLVAEYRIWREWPTRRVEITTQAYWSPGEILPNESNSRYNQLRPGAVNKWIYGKTTFRYLERLPMGFALSFWARGQYSSQNLLPTEQMGIGGYNTVRGYDENQLTMDRAFIANLELRTPALPVISMIRKYPVKDGLQFLIFADYGMGSNHNIIGTKTILYKDYLLGVGPGVRYTLDPYLSARLDFGIRLHNQAEFAGETSMVHFSTVFSY